MGSTPTLQVGAVLQKSWGSTATRIRSRRAQHAWQCLWLCHPRGFWCPSGNGSQRLGPGENEAPREEGDCPVSVE